jgi:hypothetical protein
MKKMNKRIRLIDIDSKIPNLALMQLSTWHKQQGDIVGFDVENPDIVYVSCVFTKNAGQAKGIAALYPDADVRIGGTGVDLKLKIPLEAQKAKPDYDLYPDSKYILGKTFKGRYSLGFTTRGCIRRCPFCFVPEKEGNLHRWQHISEFHEERFKHVIVLDNNITADKEWFFENTDFVLENRLKFNAIQGMDVRLLDEEIAERIKELRWIGQIHFAWDNIGDEEAVKRGIELLKDVGMNTKHDVSFYVLVGYNTAFEQDLYRCNTLRDLRVSAFVMQYSKTPETKALARWANRPHVFWGHEFKEYDRKPTSLKGQAENHATLIPEGT